MACNRVWGKIPVGRAFLAAALLIAGTIAIINPVYGQTGGPSLSGLIVAQGVDPSGAFFADLRLSNTGNGPGKSVSINQLPLRTLSGAGTVTYNSPTLPILVGDLPAGASTTTRLFFAVPSTVSRFSITENGTLQNATGTTLNFSIAQAVIPGAPRITSVDPNRGQQGQQNLTVTLTGQFTHWVQGATTANFGGDISVTSVTVNSGSSATAILNIDSAAVLGIRSVTVTTGTEIVVAQNAFTVAGPSALSFMVQPSTAAAGVPVFPAVQVAILDANGKVLTGARQPVTISLAANSSGAILSGTRTQNAQNGVATFPGLSVNKPGKGYTLIASSSGLTITSTPFDVSMNLAQLDACVPASSQSVLVQGKNVSAYIPNGSYGVNQKNVQFVPLEGSGSRATIVTPAAVNSCASNSVTGQTVCTANNSDVYLINGPTLTNTLTSGSNSGVGFPFISGGSCLNCGVTMNAVANQAVIAMGISPGGAGIQILDLNTNTFANPITSNGFGISESILVDPLLNLVLSPVETRHYGLFDMNAGGKIYDWDISGLVAPASDPDGASEDCTTRIALASEEDSFPPQIFLADLTQIRLDSASSTWTAPAQSQVFPEFNNVAPVGIAIASAVHLGIAAGEAGNLEFGVIRLPATSGSGTPAVLDYVAAVFPKIPGGQTFSVAGDPHTITAYTSPNDGKAYGMVLGNNSGGDHYLALIDLQGVLDALRSVAHRVDPALDLLNSGLVRYVSIGQPPAQLSFISQPTSAAAGQVFQVKVEVDDAQGNIDSNNTFPISLAVSETGQQLGTVTAANGVATFQIVIQQTGTFKLLASAPSLPSATSAPLTITPAAAVSLYFVTQPGNIVAGQPFSTLQVGWKDQFTNPASSNFPITLSLNNGSGATLLGTTSVTAVNGVAGFSGLTMNRSGTFTLLATGTGAFGQTQVVSATFQVTSANSAQLVFITEPATASAGQAFFAPQVAVEDAFGNTVASATNQVTLALGANSAGATLSPITTTSLTVSANAGTASWGFISVNFAGVGFTLVASSPGLKNTTSIPFNISGAGPPVTLTPASIKQGGSISVTISTPNTQFQQGVTKASFGPGLMVGGGLSGSLGPVTVTGPTTAIAQISAAATATPGPRTVVLQTGAEQDTYFDAFAVVATPFLFNISPASGNPGQTLTVTIKGEFTNFVQGATQANFGPGISVGGGPQSGYGPVTVTAPGTAIAQVAIPSGTAVGLRPVSVQTGAETASLSNGGFLVLGTITGPPPAFSFTSLTEGMEITSPTPVTGTIASPNLSTWTLDYAPAGSTSFTPFANGTTTEVSGTIDPTLLLNGMITVRLTAMDQSGQTASTAVDVVITRNLKVGNFTVSFTDLNIPVAGIPIQVVRTYDSRDKTVGDFGVGWSLSIKSVRVDVNGIIGQNWLGTKTAGLFPVYCVLAGQNHVVSVRLQNGTVYQFQAVPTPDTQCTELFPPTSVDLMFVPIGATPPGVQILQPNSVSLSVNGLFPGPLQLLDSSTFETYGTGDADQWILSLLNGSNVQVSKTFGLQAIQDANGNSLNIGPDGITSSFGPAVTFTRDAQNRITGIQDPSFRQSQYGYDSNGDLSTFTDQRNNGSKFTYDAVHDLLSFTDPTGAQPIRNVYDDSGRLIQQIDALGHVQNLAHDVAGRTETFTDFLGNTTTFVYDSRGNILRETDALGNVTAKTYDALDNVLTETNALGKVTSYTYDANNNRLSMTDPLGNTTRYVYNQLNEVLTTTDPTGNTITKTYDPSGNLLTMTDGLGHTTRHTYTNSGQLATTTDPLGNTTTYSYSAGNLITVTDPLGTEADFGYDSNRNRISQSVTRTTASGKQALFTQHQYDAQNHLVATIFPDGSAVRTTFDTLGQKSSTTDELGRQTSYNYDADRRLVSTAYADGTSETNTYDAVGNKLTFTDRSGATTTYAYDPLHRLTATTDSAGALSSAAYDAAGQRLSSTDALGNVTRYGYDDAGRQTSITDALNRVRQSSFDANSRQTSTKDAAGQVTTFRYDAVGRPTQVVHPDGSIGTLTYDAANNITATTDAAGKTSLYSYDGLRRLASITDAIGGITTYAYDELGNRVSMTDANGHITRFQYDQRGRRSSRVLPGGQSETFAYDAAGQLASHTDFNGKTTAYQYDSAGRLLSKAPDPSFNAPPVTFTYTALGKRASMSDASGTTTYNYDILGRLISKQSAIGNIAYNYDVAGNLTSLQAGNVGVTYSYDPLNRLASVSEPATGTTFYNYNPVGTLQSMAYPNGVVHAFNYDSLNRLTTLSVSSNNVPAASYFYTLDPAGHRLSVAELGGRSVNYGYDAVYRLTNENATAVSGPGGAVSYTYDAVANRLQTASTLAGVSSGTFTYDADDRLADDLYDAAGNTISFGGTSNLYDFENHLIQRGSTSIVYDGDGNRVSETANGVTTKYLIDSLNPTRFPQVIAETASDGSARTFVYGMQRISQRQSSPGSNSPTSSFYVYDGHGSVRALANAAGAITDTYDYDAFGNVIKRNGTTFNNYLFAGEQFDPALGIYYNRARYYDERRGRFWTMDALEGVASDPLSLHKYLYVRANPVTHHDPSGNEDDLVGEMAALEISAELDVATQVDVGATLVGQTFLAADIAGTELATGTGAALVAETGFTVGGAGLELANTAFAEAFVEARIVEVGGELVIEITDAAQAEYLIRVLEILFFS